MPKDTRLNLVHLIEECAEVQHMASKCLRFGLDDFHPKREGVNRKMLGMEIGNLYYMVDLLTETGIIDTQDIWRGRESKQASLERWYGDIDSCKGESARV